MTTVEQAERILKKYQPISHREMAERLGCDIYETQELVRKLKRRGKIKTRLDWRYEVK